MQLWAWVSIISSRVKLDEQISSNMGDKFILNSTSDYTIYWAWKQLHKKTSHIYWVQMQLLFEELLIARVRNTCRRNKIIVHFLKIIVWFSKNEISSKSFRIATMLIQLETKLILLEKLFLFSFQQFFRNILSLFFI